MTRGDKNRVRELIDRIRTDAKLIEDEMDLIPEVRMQRVQETVDTILATSKGDSIKDRAFRNAARFVQNAIDGTAPDFELIPENGVYVHIVRCGECKHRYTYEGVSLCDYVDFETRDEDFCSKGERDENTRNTGAVIGRGGCGDDFDGSADSGRG